MFETPYPYVVMAILCLMAGLFGFSVLVATPFTLKFLLVLFMTTLNFFFMAHFIRTATIRYYEL